MGPAGCNLATSLFKPFNSLRVWTEKTVYQTCWLTATQEAGTYQDRLPGLGKPLFLKYQACADGVNGHSLLDLACTKHDMKADSNTLQNPAEVSPCSRTYYLSERTQRTRKAASVGLRYLPRLQARLVLQPSTRSGQQKVET